MANTEDVPYSAPDFATPDPEKESEDPEQPQKGTLQQVSNYLEDCLEHDQKIDSLDLSKECPLTLEQQVFVNKRDNARLRTVKEYIDNKIKELK